MLHGSFIKILRDLGILTTSWIIKNFVEKNEEKAQPNFNKAYWK